MARLLGADGSETKVAANGKKFSLVELQAYVGGYIQVLDHWVTVLGKRQRVRMIINEEGKLRGLPYNKVATELIGEVLMPGDHIVGTALVLEKGEGI